MNIAGRKFLLVEDEPIIGFALEDMMLEEGAETHFASSLDVLDVNLHGRDSYSLARKLLDSGAVVVFATGYGVEPLPDDLSKVETVAKPYSIDALRAAFGRVEASG